MWSREGYQAGLVDPYPPTRGRGWFIVEREALLYAFDFSPIRARVRAE